MMSKSQADRLQKEVQEQTGKSKWTRTIRGEPKPLCEWPGCGRRADAVLCIQCSTTLYSVVRRFVSGDDLLDAIKKVVRSSENLLGSTKSAEK